MVKRIFIITLSVLFAGAFIFTLIWTCTNWNTVKQAMNGTNLYTNSDLNNAYEDGYKTALDNKEEYVKIIDNYKDTITTQLDQISKLSSQITILTNNNKDYLTQITNLTNLKTENENIIENLTNKNNDNESRIISLNNEIVTLNNSIELLTKTNEYNDDEIAILSNQVSTLRQLISELETTCNSNLVTIGSLNSQNSVLKAQINELQSQLLTNNSSIYELNARISDLEQSVAFYESYIIELENQNHTIAIFEFNGSVYSIEEIDNNKVNIQDPTSTEYIIFKYWTVNGIQIDLENYTITENTKFVANLTYKYKVQFIADDEIIDTIILENNSQLSIPTTPTKDKYNFIGWSVDGINTINVEDYIITTHTNFIALFENKYGLFNTDTGALIYSWDELLTYNYLSVTNTELSAGVNVKRLSGDLIIDEIITVIADSTFYGCSALVNVDMSDNLTNIGGSAFYNCASLLNIRFSNNLQSIGSSCFYACSSLDNVFIPDSLTSLGNAAFYKCTELKNLRLSNSLATIGVQVFTYCSSLESVDLPESIIELGNFCFAYTGIINIDLKNVRIVNYSFANCQLIERIIVGDCIENIACDYRFLPSMKYNVYEGCNYLGNENNPYLVLTQITDTTVTSVNFASTTRILNYTFYNNTAITSITLPETVVAICDYTFSGCSALESVVMGDNVIYIGSSVFSNCRKLTNINLSSNLIKIDNSAFSYCTILESIVLPTSLKSIGNRAFESCWKLVNVFFENGESSLEYIGYYSFLSCSKLSSIYIPATVITIDVSSSSGYSPFRSCPASLVIYCGISEAAIGWQTYWNCYNTNFDELTVNWNYTYEQYLAEIGG